MARLVLFNGLLATMIAVLSCGDPSGPELPRDELAYRSLGADPGLYVMRADGSSRHRIWSSTDDLVMCSSWSPDGSTIAFHKFYANQIVVVTVSTGAERTLTTGPYMNHCPMWSPDGRRIAFLRVADTMTSGYPLYVMNANGTNPTRLGTGTFMADRGSWSPDGKAIALSRYSDNHIVLVNATTGAVSAPLTPPGGGRGPSWSPDGQRITFMAQEGSSQGIYVMDANGRNRQRLTSTPFIDQYPVWTPDGRLIAFHRYQFIPDTTLAGAPPRFIPSLRMVHLDGTDVPWLVGALAEGDLIMWRPRR